MKRAKLFNKLKEFKQAIDDATICIDKKNIFSIRYEGLIILNYIICEDIERDWIHFDGHSHYRMRGMSILLDKKDRKEVESKDEWLYLNRWRIISTIFYCCDDLIQMEECDNVQQETLIMIQDMHVERVLKNDKLLSFLNNRIETSEDSTGAKFKRAKFYLKSNKLDLAFKDINDLILIDSENDDYNNLFKEIKIEKRKQYWRSWLG